MKKHVIIVDTSILVVWLQVPGFNKAGKLQLSYADINDYLQSEIKKGSALILTMAVIIETGNHIAQIKNPNLRQQMVNKFADFLIGAVQKIGNWQIYYSENEFWNPTELLNLANQWRTQGIYKLSLGDSSILKVANNLKPVFNVEVYTGDSQLYSLSLLSPKQMYAPKGKRN